MAAILWRCLLEQEFRLLSACQPFWAINSPRGGAPLQTFPTRKLRWPIGYGPNFWVMWQNFGYTFKYWFCRKLRYRLGYVQILIMCPSSGSVSSCDFCVPVLVTYQVMRFMSELYSYVPSCELCIKLLVIYQVFSRALQYQLCARLFQIMVCGKLSVMRLVISYLSKRELQIRILYS